MRVSDSKTLQLLVVEDNLEDEQFLCEALSEIEENRLWSNWRAAGIVQVDRLADALDCLRRRRFDAVLLNLSLPDSPALLDTFLEVAACAGETPILVLADEPDENLANRLLRLGAEDVVLKAELECGPLARSVRYAIERKRRMAALHTLSLVDDLTGTLTRQGFLAVAERYAALPARAEAAILLSFLEISELPETPADDRETRELLLLRAGEALRGAFPAPTLVGRTGKCRFEVMTVGIDRKLVESLLNRAATEVEEASWTIRYPASVRFQLMDPGAPDLNQMLASLSEPPTERKQEVSKTVMLLD